VTICDFSSALGAENWRAIMPPYRRSIQPFAAGRIAQKRSIDRIFDADCPDDRHRQAGWPSAAALAERAFDLFDGANSRANWSRYQAPIQRPMS
jgi:hypothetical protein